MDFEKLKELLKKDYFATQMGAEITEISEGGAVTVLEVNGNHLNAGNITQGGVVFTLGDYAMAAAANSRGKLAFSIQNDIKYLLSTTKGAKLRAVAREVSLGRTISNYAVEVFDQDNRLIATGSGVFFRKDANL
ncbi:MAG: PaaI family thioesterase [Rikenellaceae bacterium]